MDISNKGEDQRSMSKRKYIHWQDEGVEKIPPNEKEDIQAVADMINSMQKAQYNNHRHCYTGTHARTQGIIKGKLIINDDLPEHLKQCMFPKGVEHPVVYRYSSEPGDSGLDDRIPQPRGFAKIPGPPLPAIVNGVQPLKVK